MIFKVNNRVDVYDVKDKIWREATVVEVFPGASVPCGSVKVHYKGFNDKYDTWIDCIKESARIMEVGSYSRAEGYAKHSLRIQQELKENESSIKD